MNAHPTPTPLPSSAPPATRSPRQLHLTDISARSVRDVPWVSIAQMRQVDRLMVEDFDISLYQMMEHAGRHLAHLARQRFLRGDPRGARVQVLAGIGGNGGGALVAARRLASWGARVRILPAAEAHAFGEAARYQLEVARRLMIPIHGDDERTPSVPDLILDGLIGFGLRGEPAGRTATLIDWANATRVPILALDVPSGLDADTGVAGATAIRATATMTLALPKHGLRAARAAGHVGELYLADIGVPRVLYERAALGIPASDVFAASDLVRLV